MPNPPPMMMFLYSSLIVPPDRSEVSSLVEASFTFYSFSHDLRHVFFPFRESRRFLFSTPPLQGALLNVVEVSRGLSEAVPPVNLQPGSSLDPWVDRPPPLISLIFLVSICWMRWFPLRGDMYFDGGCSPTVTNPPNTPLPLFS